MASCTRLGNLSLGMLSARIGRRSGVAMSLSVQIVASLFFFFAHGDTTPVACPYYPG